MFDAAELAKAAKDPEVVTLARRHVVAMWGSDRLMLAYLGGARLSAEERAIGLQRATAMSMVASEDWEVHGDPPEGHTHAAALLQLAGHLWHATTVTWTVAQVREAVRAPLPRHRVSDEPLSTPWTAHVLEEPLVLVAEDRDLRGISQVVLVEGPRDRGDAITIHVAGILQAPILRCFLAVQCLRPGALYPDDTPGMLREMVALLSADRRRRG